MISNQPTQPVGRPSVLRRLCYFVLGASIGGLIAYGMLTSGPGPVPSFLDPRIAGLVFGLPVVCGLLAAYSPDRFWRRSRRFGWRDDDWYGKWSKPPRKEARPQKSEGRPNHRR